MIKAIETTYKGYRFRSRLEARWAVAFDACGVSWTYEEEGFDLGERVGWYLPDFRLDFGRTPDLNPTIEIKPLSARPYGGVRLPKVYMAGSMRSGEGWRGIGVTDRSSRTGSTFSVNEWAGSSFLAHGRFIYVGPFSISDDHGCAHGSPHMAFGCGDEFFGEKTRYRRELIEECQDRIFRCDIFAAYIDRDDCFGTLVEIGMAKAMDKLIWVGISPDVARNLAYKAYGYIDEEEYRAEKDHEMWFAQDLADHSVIVDKDKAADAFNSYVDSIELKRLPSEITQGLAISSSGQLHFVIYGDPMECSVFNCRSGQFETNASMLGINDYAAMAARSARFEHGQRGAA